MAVLFRPWVLALVTIGLAVCLLTASADAFRLRDYDVDEDQRTTMETSRRKIQYRRSAVDEVVKKRVLVDDDDEDDDDDDDVVNDDEDEEEERAAESKYKFEKVRRSYRTSPSQKRETTARKEQLEPSKATKSTRKFKPLQKVVVDEDDDDDDEDEDEEEQVEKSIFNLFGLLGSKKVVEVEEDVVETKTKASAKKKIVEDDDDDESDSWIDRLKNMIPGDSNKDDDDGNEEPEDDENSGGFFGWLKELTEKADDADDHDDKNTDDNDDDDEDREKENPLINLFSSLLNSDKEETSEEIKFRPIGDEDDDDSSSSKEDTKKPKKESKIVQLLNASPLNNLFKADDLPQESTISTDPKKVKKQQTPSKVVKQRIEISPEDFESLLLRIPSFVPDYSRLKNNECRRQGQIFQRQLRGKRLWALQMIDASAKVTSGLLRGNANQLGDYDLCTGIATKVKVKEDEQVRMRGKYCLAHVDVVAEDDDLKLPVHLLQGRGFIKSTLNDPDHFLPRFTTINWGICLPAACSYEDASHIVENFVKPYNSTGIKLFLEIEEGNCHVRQTAGWSKLFKDNWQLVASLGFYTFVLVVTLVASLNDFGVIQIEPHPKLDDANTPSEDTNLLHQMLMSFSVKRTFRQLFGGEDETLAGKDVVGCLSGLRAIATLVMFCALRLIPMGFQPFTNRNEFTESFNSPWSVTLRVLMLYADVYLVVSGFLAAYHMVGEFQQSQKVPWFRKIVGRYLRLTLPLIPVLIFYSWVWEHLGNGPQWGDVVVKNANLCKHNFWNNLFFIQNWYPVEEGCAPHTFQLAIEMQLAIIAPFLLIILTKNPLYGVSAYVTLHGVSTAIRFVATNEDRLSPYIYHGIRLTQIYRTVNLSFSETLHRATPYLAGFGLGYLLRETQLMKHDRGINLSGWIGAAIAFGWCFVFPLDTAEKDFQFDLADAAQYSALAPLSFALAVCWIIYYCVTNESSLLNRILSCKLMVFLSKISYSVSLIQFLVFFYFAGTTRGSEVFSIAGYLDRTEICLLLIGGTALTLLYDLPIQNIKLTLDRSGIFDRMEKKDTTVVVALSAEVTQNGTEKPLENGHSTVEKEEEPQPEPEPDFESPFADREEDDLGPRQSWKRETPEPEPKSASPTKGFWDDVEESDAPEPLFKAPSPVKVTKPQAEEEETIEEEAEEEEQEEEEEAEEDEEEEEEDEEKEVIRRPTGAQSFARTSVSPKEDEPVKPPSPPPPARVTAPSSPSPPFRRRQWRRNWDD